MRFSITMIKNLTPVFLFSISLPISALEVSFDDIKQLIETKNGKVLSQKKKAEAAKFREGVLDRSFLPKLSISGGYETFEVGSKISKQQPYYGVETSINIYNGGKDYLQDQIQELTTEIKETQVKVITIKELGHARELFWKIVYLQEELKLLDKMQSTNNKNLQAAERRIKAGVATPSDRLEFEMKDLDLRRSKKQTEAKKKALSYELVIHLGYDAHEPLKVNNRLLHNDEWEQDLKHAHEDHDVLTKPYELSVKKLNIKKVQEQRSWTPKLDIYAGWYQFNQREESRDTSRERQESAIGIKLTMNLFDGFSSKKESQALNAEASAASATSLFNKRKNEAHIEQEFLELKTLHEQVHDAKEHITKAKQYYQATQKEYTRGAKNSPDVLGATERLEEVTRTKNQLIRDFHIARSHVLSKIGR